MVFESTLIMTLIDLAFVGLALGSAAVLARARRHPHVRLGITGPTFAVVGVSIVGLFYGVDLFVMLGLPSLIDAERAHWLMQAMHLNVSWPVNLAAAGCVTAGVILSTRTVQETTGILEQQSKRLLSSLAARRHRAFKLAKTKERLQSLAQRVDELEREHAEFMRRELEENLEHPMEVLRIHLAFMRSTIGYDHGSIRSSLDEMMAMAEETSHYAEALAAKLASPGSTTLGLRGELEYLADALGD